MHKLYSSDKIYISDSKILNAGRGVFARVAIGKGERIERCPVIEIPMDHAPSINESMLVTYIYYLGKDKERLMIALGFGSLYNHSRNSNAMHEEVRVDGFIDFIATRDIEKDEEITVNYQQGNPKGQDPLWLEVT